MIPQTAPQLIEEFLISRNSEATRVQYRLVLNTFFKWKPSTVSLVRSTFVAYKTHLLTEGYSHGTVNKNLSALKSYISFLIQCGAMEANPMEGFRCGGGKYNPTNQLTNDEVRLVFSKIPESTTGNLHRALLSFLFYLGLRRSELCALKVCDLGQDGEFSFVRILGKGNKQRMSLLPGAAKEALFKYLAVRGPVIDSNSPLFVSSSVSDFGRNSHLSAQTVYYVFKKYARLAGINKRVSPHSARVTLVSNALENGANPIYVQAQGGWSSMDMILKYDRRRTELKNSAANFIDYTKK